MTKPKRSIAKTIAITRNFGIYWLTGAIPVLCNNLLLADHFLTEERDRADAIRIMMEDLLEMIRQNNKSICK